MTDAELLGALEAILFLYGEPLAIEKIASFLAVPEERAREVCAQLADYYSSNESRGLMIIGKDGQFQVVTKPKFGGFLESFLKESLKEDLTPAALETLSLVAYFGPITRAHIDFVRGVNSSFTLRNLLIRGLIERKLTGGNAYAYEVTFDFLKHLGIGKTSEMPKFEEYGKLRDQLFSHKEEEI